MAQSGLPQLPLPRLTTSQSPEPTTDQPSDEELRDMLLAGTCPATDGCPVEPDGTCPHGHPAWPRRLSLL